MSDRLLVTGAGGMLGRVVSEALLAAGFAVRGQFAHAPGPERRVEWRHADFMTSLAVDDLVEGCAGVINLAGEVAVAERMYRLNAEAPRALLDAAARSGARYFGHASSISVYGSPRGRVLDETSETVDPDRASRQVFESPAGVEYARTKRLGELALMTGPTVARVDLYRIAKAANFERLLEATTWSRSRRLLALHGLSHAIFERDCADAIVHLTARGLAGAGAGVEIVNIADAEAWTYGRALAYVEARLGGKPSSARLFLPAVAELLKNAVKYRTLAPRVSIAMARVKTDRLTAAGYSPRIGYARALEMAVDDRLARGGALSDHSNKT